MWTSNTTKHLPGLLTNTRMASSKAGQWGRVTCNVTWLARALQCKHTKVAITCHKAIDALDLQGRHSRQGPVDLCKSVVQAGCRGAQAAVKELLRTSQC